MKRLVLLALVAATSLPARAGAPLDTDAEWISMLKKHVADQLIDSESARIKDINVYARLTRHPLTKEEQPIGAVCGFVNAKNKFGGYVGMRPFIIYVVNGPSVTIFADGTESHALHVRNLCKEAEQRNIDAQKSMSEADLDKAMCTRVRRGGFKTAPENATLEQKCDKLGM